MKKIILSFITIICIFSSSLINIASAQEYNDGAISVELKDIDLSLYEKENKTQIITLSEVGFETQDYKLIIYVWNNDKNELNKNSFCNLINIATTYNSENKPIGYNNLKLKYISSTQDNSIYKFSVIDSENQILHNARKQFATTGKRRYDVAGIQLLGVNNKLATDYLIGKNYIYSGIDNLTIESFHPLKLEVHPVWYKTKTSDKGKNYQHQLNAVYFSVPDEYLKDGYRLDAVKAEWYEYSTEPIFVIEDKELFSSLQSVKALPVNSYDENLPTLYYNQKYIGQNLHFDWSYNLYAGSKYYPNLCDDRTDRVTILFNDKKDSIISSERLKNYIYSYDNSAVKGYLPVKNGQISADLFKDSVDEGRTRGYNVVTIYADQKTDLLSYSDTATFWDKVADYGLLSAIFGTNLPLGDKSISVEPIKQVNADDVKDINAISNNLLIDSSLCSDFKNFYNNSEQENRTTFLFRFANTDYKSFPVTNYDFSPEDCGHVAWQTVFLDFDIIHLEFYNDNERLVVPVVSDPIDIIPSITPPPVWDNKWILYGIITVLALLGVGVIYSIIKKGAK